MGEGDASPTEKAWEGDGSTYLYASYFAGTVRAQPDPEDRMWRQESPLIPPMLHPSPALECFLTLPQKPARPAIPVLTACRLGLLPPGSAGLSIDLVHTQCWR